MTGKKSCDELRAKGVKVLMEPGKAPFGIQALIANQFDGNRIFLIEHPK